MSLLYFLLVFEYNKISVYFPLVFQYNSIFIFLPQIRVDHRSECIHFGADLSESQREDLPEGPMLQSLPSETIRCQLVQMGSALQSCLNIIVPDNRKVCRKCCCKCRAHIIVVDTVDLCFYSPALTSSFLTIERYLRTVVVNAESILLLLLLLIFVFTVLS